jgi:hypothetical protein
MKKKFLRAALVACLPLCAMGLTVATVPAYAAEKAATPKVSSSINKFMVNAKKANDSKDWPTVISNCEDALKVSDLTDYDKYLIERFLGVAYFGVNNHAKAKESFMAVVRNPATPPEDRKYLITPATELAAEAKDDAGVIEMGKLAIQDNIVTADLLATLAVAYYQGGDLNNTIETAKKSIAAAATEGKLPQYGLYQVLAFSYDKQKNRVEELNTFKLMARDYGNPDDWRYAIDLSLEQLPGTNKSAREIAALDIYRLRMTVNAAWDPINYAEMADAAQSMRAYGDAQAALKAGLAAGKLTQAKVGALLNQVNADARKDEPSLPQVEKLAKTGKEVINVAEGYYGYGRYADAARVAEKALGMGGATQTQARLLLGMAQTKMGNEAAAAQTLANFSGDPALVSAASLWNIYLQRKNGKAPAAAPAPAK